MEDKNNLATLRRSNLASWMEKNQVNQSEIAKKLGLGRAYVSLLFNPERFFGEKIARKIEQGLGLPELYLDSDQQKPLSIEGWSQVADLSDDIYALVPRIHLKHSVEKNSVVDIEQNLPPLPFRSDWLKKKQVSQKENLRIVDVLGDSMNDYLHDGDFVLIDLGQTEIQDNNVYVITYGNELRVKRLSKRFDGGLFIRSDNKNFPEELLSAEQAKSIKVVGKVLWRAG